MIINKELDQFPCLQVTFQVSGDDLQFNECLVFNLHDISKQLNTPVEGLNTDSEDFFHLIASGYVDFRGALSLYNLASFRQIGLAFSNNELEAEIVYTEQITQEQSDRLETALIANPYTFPEDFQENR